MIEIRPPHNISDALDDFCEDSTPSPPVSKILFLAGSIENGAAELWQDKVIEALADLDVLIFNPRRADWDSSWVAEASNPQFAEQVNWELDALDQSDLILFYFDPNTKSPITLLELGLHCHSTTIVCCPKGYWRRGNVDIVCQRNKTKQVDSLEELIKEARIKCNSGAKW